MPILGLAERRLRWGLTLGGWMVMGFLIAGLGLAGIRFVHDFLTPYHPVKCDLLVVEGWLHDAALEEATQVFAAQACRQLVTVGPELELGSYLSPYHSYAELAATTLERLGFEVSLIHPVPSKLVQRDRTYAAALALKRWLSQAKTPVRSLNIYALGPHARRSWFLYHSVLGDNMKVGVIPSTKVRYNPDRWWTSSNGVRTVLSEMIAYLYARFFFYPTEG